MTPADCVDEMLARVDAVLAEPEPAEHPSTLPPPPTTRTRDTVRPGAQKEQGR